MKKNLATVALTTVVLLAVVFLAFHLHRTSKEEFLAQFNERQLLIARQAALQIESYFRSRAHDIQWLSSFSSLQHRDTEKMPADIQANFERLKPIHVEEISVFDEKGTIVYSTTADAIGSNHARSDFYAWAMKPGNRRLVRLVKENADKQGKPSAREGPEPPHPRISLVTPLYLQEAAAGDYPRPPGKFAGILSLTVDLEKMLAERTLLFAPTMKLHKLWILDKDGTILLQSEHPAMAMRNIRERDGTCNQCHASFDYVEKMLTAAQGAVEYRVKGYPKKIAAFAPMIFEDNSWIVVVNAPYDEVTGFIRGNLKDTLGLLGIVALVIGLASFSMHRNYRQKVSAQEEAKHLREKQRLTEALRESEERYRTIVETSHDIIWTLDKQGKFTFVNRRGEEFSGYKVDELVRKSFIPLIHPEDLAKVQQVFLGTLSGKPHSYDVRVHDRNGKVFILSVDTVPLYENENVIGTLSFGRDITERTRAEEALRETRDYLENLFGYANAPIIVWDPTFRITRFNRAFEHLTGYSAGEVVGQELHALFPEASRDESLEKIARTSGGERWESVEIPILRKDGEIRLALWNSANIYAKDGTTVIATIAQGQDITERARAERDLRRRIRELDVLYTIGRAGTQSMKLQEILDNALEATITALQVETGGIFLLDPDGRTLTMCAHRGLSDEFVKNTRKIQLGEGVSGRAAAEKKPVVLDAADYPSERLAPYIVREGFQTLASTPLVSAGETIGALNLGMRRSRAFPPEEMQLLAAIGRILGQGVRNVQLYESIQQELAERKRAEETLRRQRDELDARSRILGATFGAKDLNERMGLILDKLMEFLGVEFGCIYLVRGDAVELRSWRGISDEFRAHALSFSADRTPGFVRGPMVIRERLGERGLMPEFAKSDGMQSWASFPLNIPGQGGGEEVEWLGTLVVGSRRFEALSELDVAALNEMVGQLALAIDHARSYRHAEERLARLQALRDIDKGIIQNLDLREILFIVLERVPKELGADAVAISLLDETRSRTSVFAMRLPNGTYVEEEAFSLADSLLHWFVERRETIIIYDTMQDPRLQMNRVNLRGCRITSYLGVPLIIQDRTIGILHIMTTSPKVFDSEDVEFFRTLAGQTAIAIENARASEVLRVSERKYRTLFEESKDVVYISTPEGRFIDINPAGVALFGYSSREELLTIDIPRDLYFTPRDRERYRQEISREGYVKDFEVVMKRKDGEKLIVLSTATAVYDEEGSVVAYRGMLRDITRFKQLEHQFTQSQKMEAIGRLSGGLAHDINNYLGAMTGYCELVKMTHENDMELAKKMDIIVNTGFKASSLLKQLLAFSRKQPMQPEVVDLNRIVEGMEKMLKRLIGEDIRLETNLRKDIRNTKVDPSQVEQILVNLVVNARNAMPRGGEITIETATVEFDRDYLLNRPVAKEGEYVMLAVSDTGIGIPEEIRDKIFEPFFTTDAAKGSGLGLSTVYGIVKQNEGYIWVYSELGRGSTFKVYFPTCREKIPALERKDTPIVTKEGGSRKILFVEDNDSMREAFRTVLEGMGYRIIAAPNGEAALKQFAEQGRDVDLLITDVVLPGINGKELMERIKKTKKDLKVLFISGYTSNVIASHGILHEGINFLQKPFTAADLAKKVAEVLES